MPDPLALSANTRHRGARRARRTTATRAAGAGRAPPAIRPDPAVPDGSSWMHRGGGTLHPRPSWPAPVGSIIDGHPASPGADQPGPLGRAGPRTAPVFAGGQDGIVAVPETSTDEPYGSRVRPASPGRTQGPVRRSGSCPRLAPPAGDLRGDAAPGGHL